MVLLFYDLRFAMIETSDLCFVPKHLIMVSFFKIIKLYNFAFS